jgi:hypothetical protein
MSSLLLAVFEATTSNVGGNPRLQYKQATRTVSTTRQASSAENNIENDEGRGKKSPYGRYERLGVAKFLLIIL